jgi:hypothetical protein
MTAQGIEYVFRMRYLTNTLRVWISPKVCVDQGYKPLMESRLPKDRWIMSDVEALTYPPVPKELAQDVAQLLFSGPDRGRMNRSPNLQRPGGSTALAVNNNNKVQELPTSLPRMQASVRSKAAFNRMVMRKK